MRSGLRLLVLEAFPEEIGGELSVDHGGGEFLCPGEAFVVGTAAVPRRGEGRRWTAFGVPLWQRSLAQRRGRIRAVGVGSDDIQVRSRSSIHERSRVRALRVPTNGITTGEVGVQTG